MSEIVLIAGSPTAHSRTAALLEYVRSILCRHRLNVGEIIGVRDLDAEDLLFARSDSPTIRQACQRIAAARAVIIATPIYKAAYTGVLKAFLDVLPQDALRGKVVLPLATAGSPAHLLALDYALKPVLSALGAQHLLQGVYITDKQVLQYGQDVELRLEPEVDFRLLRALEDVADSLTQVERIPALAGGV